MIRCEFCNNEDGCIEKGIEIDGEYRPRIPYTIPFFDERYQRCHDCGVLDQRYHHPGCDMETCINCGGQLISCDCHVGTDGVKIPTEVLRHFGKGDELQ